jgi:hypothetical protein
MSIPTFEEQDMGAFKLRLLLAILSLSALAQVGCTRTAAGAVSNAAYYASLAANDAAYIARKIAYWL